MDLGIKTLVGGNLFLLASELDTPFVACNMTLTYDLEQTLSDMVHMFFPSRSHPRSRRRMYLLSIDKSPAQLPPAPGPCFMVFAQAQATRHYPKAWC